MPMSQTPLTFNEDIMSKYETTFVELIDDLGTQSQTDVETHHGTDVPVPG